MKIIQRKYSGEVDQREMKQPLQQQGVESIFVETDNYRNTAFRLYKRVGFRVIRDILV